MIGWKYKSRIVSCHYDEMSSATFPCFGYVREYLKQSKVEHWEMIKVFSKKKWQKSVRFYNTTSDRLFRQLLLSCTGKDSNDDFLVNPAWIER